MVAGVASVALIAGARVASRADEPERRRPTADAAVTATVEQAPLTSSSIVRASVETVDEVAVVAPPRLEGQISSVVTAVHATSDRPVTSGAAVVEINGRPIMALATEIPPYRDLLPGTALDSRCTGTAPADVRGPLAALPLVRSVVFGDSYEE